MPRYVDPVAPWGSTVVPLAFHAPSAPSARIPLGVVLRCGTAQTLAIPLDIRVE